MPPVSPADCTGGLQWVFDGLDASTASSRPGLGHRFGHLSAAKSAVLDGQGGFERFQMANAEPPKSASELRKRLRWPPTCIIRNRASWQFLNRASQVRILPGAPLPGLRCSVRAHVTGTSAPTVNRWRMTGTVPGRRSDARLRELQAVVDSLGTVLRDEPARVWLRSPTSQSTGASRSSDRRR
jgi:hypothetical protein